MQFLAIVVLCVLAAVTYGIVHDQVTVRVCIEYFTIGHPPVFATTSPTLLALGWGVIATWWVGLPLGIVLATAARVGSRPKLTAINLLRPLSFLLLAMALLALASGVLGWVLASRGDVSLPEPLFSRVFRYEKSNAQPIVGHQARVQGIRKLAEKHPGLLFAGAAFDGVGIPDCVRQANEAAAAIIAQR